MFANFCLAAGQHVELEFGRISIVALLEVCERVLRSDHSFEILNDDFVLPSSRVP